MSLICPQSIVAFSSVAAVGVLTWKQCGIVGPLPSLLFAVLTALSCSEGTDLAASTMSGLTVLTAFLSIIVCGGLGLLDGKKNEEGMPCMSCQF